MKNETVKINGVEFIRISNDRNGNPRVIVSLSHFALFSERGHALVTDRAMVRARRLGGKLYRGADFSGYAVFICFSVRELEHYIFELMTSEENALRVRKDLGLPEFDY